MSKYTLSTHAIERAAERLGIKEAHNATNYINQIMQVAYYNGETPSKFGGKVKVYDYHKANLRILVGANNVVVTIIKIGEFMAVPDAFRDDVMTVIKRKFNAMKATYTKRSRALTIELAEWNFEVAKLELNKAKAKSPKAQEQIQSKIDELMVRVNRINFELDEVEREFNESTKGVELLLA